jgi:hypothetical protein
MHGVWRIKAIYLYRWLASPLLTYYVLEELLQKTLTSCEQCLLRRVTAGANAEASTSCTSALLEDYAVSGQQEVGQSGIAKGRGVLNLSSKTALFMLLIEFNIKEIKTNVSCICMKRFFGA